MKIVVGLIVICTAACSHADICNATDQLVKNQLATPNSEQLLARGETVSYSLHLEEAQLFELTHSDISANWQIHHNDTIQLISNKVGPTGSSFAILAAGEHTICVWSSDKHENAGKIRLSSRARSVALSIRADLDALANDHPSLLNDRPYLEAAEQLQSESLVTEAVDAYVIHALALLRHADAASAEEHFRRAVILADQHQLNRRLPWIHYWLGNTLAALGQPNAALATFREAQAESSSSYLSARIENYIGLNLLRLGKLSEALAALERAQHNPENARNPLLSAIVKNNLGGLHLRRGEGQRAASNFDDATATYIQLDEVSLAITTLVTAATAYRSVGEYTTSLNRLHQALALEPTPGFERGEILQSLGRLHADFENWTRARDYYTSAIDDIADTQNQLAIATGRFLLGMAEIRFGNTNNGTIALSDALRTFESQGNINGALSAGCTLAETHLNNGNVESTEAVLSMLSASISQARKQNLSSAMACLSQVRGNLAIARRDFSTGESHLVDAVYKFSEIAAVAGAIGANNDLANFYFESGQLEKAQNTIDENELMLAQMIAQQGVGVDRRAIANSRRGWVDLQVNMAYQSALDARALKALTISVNNRRKAAEDYPTSGGQKSDLAQLLTQKSVLLNSDQTGLALQEVMLSLARLETEQTRDRDTKAPKTRSFDAQELTDSLPQDTTVLYYHLTPEQSYVWRLSRNNVAVYRLKSARQIHLLTDNLRAALNVRGGNTEWRQPALELAQTILQPVWPDVGTQNVVVVPDGSLVQIPFAVLPVTGSSRNALFGQEVTLSYLSHIGTPKPTAFTPPLSAAMMMIEAEELSPVLAGAEQEQAALKTLVPKGLSTQVLNLKHKSTVQSFLEQPRDILHLSAHAFAHLREPSISALTTYEDPYHSLANGLALTALEIGAMDIKSHLVVLNACETGLVTDYIGNETNSLTGAFLNAGADHVVSSLWRVPGIAAATFSKEFYHALSVKSLTIEAALSTAQEKMRRTRQWRHPHFWSGFIVTSKS